MDTMDLHFRVFSGDTEKVRNLISQHVDVDSVLFGETALMGAARLNFLDILDLLLDAGANVDAIDDAGDTALSKAAECGYVECAQRLIQAGATVGLKAAAMLGRTDDVQNILQAPKTPDVSDLEAQVLCWSAGWGQTSTLNALLGMGLGPNTPNDKGQLPLTLAARRGQRNACRMLVEHGADVNAIDGEGMSAVILAAARADFAMVAFLCSVHADLDARDRHGMTPLMWVARFHDLPTVRTVLDHGADINARDHEGLTALWWAEADQATVELLRSRGG